MHEFDTAVFATGFKVGESTVGSIIGRKKYDLFDGGSFLGVCSHSFPNLYMIYGQGPYPFGNNSVNQMPVIESQSLWTAKVIARQARVVEPKLSSQKGWIELCSQIAPSKIWAQCDSWYNNKTSPAGSTYWGTWQEYRTMLDESLIHLVFDGFDDTDSTPVQLSRSCGVQLHASSEDVQSTVCRYLNAAGIDTSNFSCSISVQSVKAVEIAMKTGKIHCTTCCHTDLCVQVRASELSRGLCWMHW